MVDRRVRIRHPLLTTLRKLDEEAAHRFPTRFAPGLGSAGLILYPKLDHHRYAFCTPLNSQTFATTGGDGTHFSLLIQDGHITERSPVTMTVPPDAQTLIVGESLFDFLCLGCCHGFFALDQLIYNPDLTLEVYTNPNWEPREKSHYSVGYVADEEERPILAFLREKLELNPWRSADHFYELQQRFGGQLELPELDL